MRLQQNRFYAALHNGEWVLARKFLYLVVGLIVLALVATFAYRFYGAELLRQAMVPSGDVAQLPRPAPIPGRSLDRAPRQARQPRAVDAPKGFQPAENPPAAVFFIHPTSFLDRSSGTPRSTTPLPTRAELFLRGQASAFNSVGLVWAPRYRQATFGAFLTSKTRRSRRSISPIATSRRRSTSSSRKPATARSSSPATAGRAAPLAPARRSRRRHAAREADRRSVRRRLAGLDHRRSAEDGPEACAGPDDTGCILSWQSFADPADPSLIVDTFDQTNGFTGQPRKGTPMLCTNPLTGKPGDSAPVEANLGTLIPART
jgi:hypothetical protein